MNLDSRSSQGLIAIVLLCTFGVYITARAVSGAPGSPNSPSTRPAMKENAPSTQPAQSAQSAAAAEACNVGEDAACGVGHWKAKTDEEWRKLLTPEQYNIARQAGTERAFTGKYWNTHTKGVYHCAACNQELFSSDTKFDSGTGWPSFFKPITPTAVTTHADESMGTTRTEVLCSNCGAHLGHLFNDGPRPTGLRYCMNSAVLNLVPAKEESKTAAKK